MTGRVALSAVTDEPLDVPAHHAAVSVPAGGADVVFCGVVRDSDHGRAVTSLEYHGHPSAPTVLEQIAEKFAGRAEVLAVAVSHRVGTLEIGDVAMVAAISTAHRAAAFTLCAELVDEVKAQLPVWKRQTFADGTDEWVNCP